MNKNDLNHVFVPYDLSIENIETLGNYQPCECYSIPPYSLTKDKDKVPEMNLEAPDKDKLFYMDFKYEQ